MSKSTGSSPRGSRFHFSIHMVAQHLSVTPVPGKSALVLASAGARRSDGPQTYIQAKLPYTSFFFLILLIKIRNSVIAPEIIKTQNKYFHSKRRKQNSLER